MQKKQVPRLFLHLVDGVFDKVTSYKIISQKPHIKDM